MIRTLHVQNFKALRDVRVELQPFTVLIGKNDTGKSSMLEAIHTLGMLVGPKPPDKRGELAVDKLAWRGADPATIGWRVELAPTPRNRLPGNATYTLRVAPSAHPDYCVHITEEALKVDGANLEVGYQNPPGQDLLVLKEGGEGTQGPAVIRLRAALSMVYVQQNFPVSKSVARSLATTVQYRLDPAQLSRASAYDFDPDAPERAPRLSARGYGLASVLDYLLGARRTAFEQIERDLREAVPFVKTIQLKPARVPEGEARAGQIGKSISFELTNGYEIAATQASDGVMLFLAYLTLVHAPSAPAVLLIEEPENGVHPRQLGRIAEYLKRLTDPSRGANAVQIVLATHSPYFLDFVPPEDVIVFGRRDNGETVTAPLLKLPGVKERLASGFSLGEMWFNVGEDRLMAEVLK